MNTRPMQRRVLGLLAAAFLIGAAIPVAAPATAAEGADGYIVVVREGTRSDVVAREQAARYGFDVTHLYQTTLNGYAASFGADVAERLRSDPNVAYVTPDFEVMAPPQPGDSLPNNAPPPYFNFQVAPNGVRRVGGSSDGKTQTLVNTGGGIGVAVIDTGIQLDHPDLKPVQNGKNCLNPFLTAEDDAGHGTHVAGTIAAHDNNFGVVGVAPAATLYAVKVLDSTGHGSWSSVICGIEWVTNNAAAKGIRVANMSLGGPGTATASNPNCSNGNNDALHTAICNSVKAGVTYVVSAGNFSVNVSTTVPAAYDEAITVSAWSDTNGAPDATGGNYTCTGWGVQSDETWATGTNYGSGVDIAAPGVGIHSTMKGSTYANLCGTSMAAPHVSGAAALVLDKWPNLTPASVRVMLMWLATPLANTALHNENLLDVSAL